MPEGRHYIIIDLKSFYASCECAMRGRDPMTTDLVVADPERGRGTICLAVSPSLKAKGVRNRCRVYEIPKCFSYIMAEPRMQLYINYAAEIYGIYLRDTLAPQTDYGLLAHQARDSAQAAPSRYRGHVWRGTYAPGRPAESLRR